MDHILVNRLRVPARIGVTGDERARPQTLVVTLDIHADLSDASESDALEDTVDYDALVTDVAELVRSTEVRLLETMADRIARKVAEVKGTMGVTVEVTKEAVPVREDVSDVSVRIERHWDD